MHFLLLYFLFGKLLSSTTCCPVACDCRTEAVECRGNITDIPSPVSRQTVLLRLFNTRITELGERSLHHVPALLGLDISHSLLKTVHLAAFSLTPRLHSLKLSSSKLSSLPGQVFSNLTSLNQLLLGFNELEVIPPGLFDGLVELTMLDLSSNRLTYLDKNVFQDLKKLVLLDLGKNSLRQLPRSVFNLLGNLRYLRLYFNQLESLQLGTFDNNTDLQELDLFNNSIRQLSPCLFWNVTKLTRLTLSRNKLQTFPAHSFYNLPQITFLSIYINPLTFLPDQLIGHMPRLKKFYLYQTELDTLPEKLFCNMTTLEILSVSFNRRLQHLPKNIFVCLSSLKRLKLEANNLEFLQWDLFSGMINLETLILSSNKLRALPNDIFRNILRLTNISLDNNQFETLPGEVLSTAAMLSKVTLKDNPWNCTCHILDFAEWVSQMQNIIEDHEHVRCHAPPHLQNASLGSLSPELVHCRLTPTVDLTVNGGHTAISLNASATENNPTVEIGPLEETSGRTLPPWFNTRGRATREGQSTSHTAALQTPSTSSITALLRTSIEDQPPESSSRSNGSPAFYEAVILEPEDSIVHHNRVNSWVYLWTLPPSGPYVTFLVVFHILLVALGMTLIVGSVCVLYRLNQAMEHVTSGTMNGKNRNTSGRKQRFLDKL